MGWDMSAATDKGSEKLTAEQLAVFAGAAGLVAQEAGSVDGGLSQGALGLSSCARALEDMTPLSTYSDWSAAEMRDAFSRAELPESFDNEYDKMHYLSAYHFMRVCVALGLGAHASY